MRERAVCERPWLHKRLNACWATRETKRNHLHIYTCASFPSSPAKTAFQFLVRPGYRATGGHRQVPKTWEDLTSWFARNGKPKRILDHLV